MNTATHEWPEIFPRDERDKAEERKLIPRDAGQYPWIFKCGHPDCTWTTAHKTEAGAQRVRDRHQADNCPLSAQQHGGKDMGAIQQKLWEHLDEATAVVMGGKPADNADPSVWEDFYKKQGNARGLATALYEFLVPEFPDSTAVVKFAVKRYKAKQAGEPMPDTPGINVGTNSPFLNQERDGALRKESQAAARKATKAVPTNTDTVQPAASYKQANPGTSGIPADKRSLVENGLAAGFKKEKLVMLTKLTMAQVDAIEAEIKAASNG